MSASFSSLQHVGTVGTAASTQRRRSKPPTVGLRVDGGAVSSFSDRLYHSEPHESDRITLEVFKNMHIRSLPPS